MNKLLQIVLSALLLLSAFSFSVRADSSFMSRTLRDPEVNEIETIGFEDFTVQIVAYRRDKAAVHQTGQAQHLLTLELIPEQHTAQNPSTHYVTLSELMNGLPYAVTAVSTLEASLHHVMAYSHPDQLQMTVRLEGIGTASTTATDVQLFCKVPIRQYQWGTITCRAAF